MNFMRKKSSKRHIKDAKFCLLETLVGNQRENMVMFKYIENYLNDGIWFWNKYENPSSFSDLNYKAMVKIP
jgi:hypothetical protein